jgi:hypothetical protein
MARGEIEERSLGLARCSDNGDSTRSPRKHSSKRRTVAVVNARFCAREAIHSESDDGAQRILRVRYLAYLRTRGASM